MSKLFKKHLVISDCQVKDNVDLSYLEHIGLFAADKKPDTIVCIGDFADMPSLSSYDSGKKSFEGRRYKKDIEVVQAAMSSLMQPIKNEMERTLRNKKKAWNPNLILTLGNHECLPPETDVLTDRGWKAIADIVKTDVVAQMDENGNLLWGTPIRTIVSDYVGEMYSFKSRSVRMTCTPNHRVLRYTSTNKLVETIAQNISSTYDIPTAVTHFNTGDLLTDEQVKLAAWCCTDSFFTQGNQVVLYQRESNAGRVRDILNSNKVQFQEVIRDRDIKEICGKVLKKRPEPSVEMTFNKSYANTVGVFDNKSLPNFVFEMSNRQWEIFLEEAIDADGSITTKSAGSRVFYGRYGICSELQAAAVLHGWSATLTEYRENQWRVNLCKKVSRRQEGVKPEIFDYTGNIYCLTTETENFIVRQDNTVFVTGNSRITRAVESDPKLEGTIGIENLDYEGFGWTVYPFLEPIIQDGIAYCHYFTSGVMGRPVASARALVQKKHQSCIMGHVQNWDIHREVRADGTPIIGLFTGSTYLHNEDYLGPQGNNYDRGVWLLHEVHNGSFQPVFVSLNYLREKYGNRPDQS